ncbi:hypothetical protein QBC40DRAFT_271702 [Triangularia verruculosa]|uniref:NmrA-like domain-containing protein n=1 Tax=Triangularia verruculosa TaxID=2587418 RepID=A0AAN6XR98_9PEZI|nr:hypothetical protein QBC40DRAFT_271702 [Triangularia verruculosa]
MPNITILPASCKTSLSTIRALLSLPSPPTITGIYRDTSKVPPDLLSNPNFTPLQGDIDDPSSLDFSTTEIIFTTTPTTYANVDILEHAKKQTENIKAAILKSSTIKKVVLLSSMGAQFSSGIGEIKTNHAAELILSTLPPTIKTTFLRCCWFIENWASSLPTLLADAENPFFYSTITPADRAIPMIAVKDIGVISAREILSEGDRQEHPVILELHGPQYTSIDVKDAFEEVLGKEVEMKLIPKEGLLEYYGAVFPDYVAREYAEMNESFLEGGVLEWDPKAEPSGEVREGETGLKEVFAELLKQQA